MSAATGPSTEEKLWATVQSKLLNDRISEDHEKRVEERNAKDETPLGTWAPVITLVLTFVAIIFALAGLDSLLVKFKYLAFAATVLGTTAAISFVLAHRGSVALDGLGKMLGLSSALLALTATGCLLMLDKLA